MILMSKSLGIAVVMSVAMTLLWLNLVQLIQVILMLFIAGSILLHLWLCMNIALERFHERRHSDEHMIGRQRLPAHQKVLMHFRFTAYHWNRQKRLANMQ